MKTGIIVHGCNLNIENWRHVAWGDPPDHLGRIPQGILVALQMHADLIVFGTGASRKEYQFGDEDEEDELLEAEYSLRYLTDCFSQLANFPALQRVLGTPKIKAFAEKQKAVLSKIRVDLKSQNTREEIINASEIFLQEDVDVVVLVSSPSHVVRCLRDAADLYATEERFARFRCHLRAVPSVTCYEGSTPADVVVIEPPHRPDRHVLPTHRRIQRMLELQKMSNDELVSLIEDFDSLLQRYEHRFYGSSQ